LGYVRADKCHNTGLRVETQVIIKEGSSTRNAGKMESQAGVRGQRSSKSKADQASNPKQPSVPPSTQLEIKSGSVVE